MSICARMLAISLAGAVFSSVVNMRMRSTLRPKRLLMDKSTNPSPEMKIQGAIDACRLWMKFSVGISLVYNPKVRDCQYRVLGFRVPLAASSKFHHSALFFGEDTGYCRNVDLGQEGNIPDTAVFHIYFQSFD